MRYRKANLTSTEVINSCMGDMDALVQGITDGITQAEDNHQSPKSLVFTKMQVDTEFFQYVGVFDVKDPLEIITGSFCIFMRPYIFVDK